MVKRTGSPVIIVLFSILEWRSQVNAQACIRCGNVMVGADKVTTHPVSSGTVFSKVEDYHCNVCNVHTTVITTTHVPGTKEKS